MSFYRKKPVVIDAMQWHGEHSGEVLKWLGHNGCEFFLSGIPGQVNNLAIKTLEGYINASPGDFIIKGVQGEFYPCKPSIFQETYEQL